MSRSNVSVGTSVRVTLCHREFS